MFIVILYTLWQPFPCQLFLSKCWGPCDNRRKPPPTDTFFHKRHTQGKLSESVMSWNPCRVRFRWRCSSEDRYTTILLQVWKSLHKVCGRLLHPPSLVSRYPSSGLGGKRSFYLWKILPRRRGKLQCDKQWCRAQVHVHCTCRCAVNSLH